MYRKGNLAVEEPQEDLSGVEGQSEEHIQGESAQEMLDRLSYK